jgi:hypothetical protein
MLVNSAFAIFPGRRCAINFSFIAVISAVLFASLSFTDDIERDLKSKQLNVAIRQIGHRLLLQAGDSTSSVTPVSEIKPGTFQLKFRNNFVFDHDSLMALSKFLLPETGFPLGYIVTVNDCATGGIVYGFQLVNDAPDMLACRGRNQPAGCYTIDFTFPGWDNNVNGTADTSEPGGNNNFKAGFGDPLINILAVTALVLLGGTFLIHRSGKRVKRSLVANENTIDVPGDQGTIDYAFMPGEVITANSRLQLPSLGQFLFDVKAQQLILADNVIKLTDKECKVLELLHQHFGNLIPRETLLQEIWINEGVITGRSLDMFVSKLRKKLSGDPALRITNVHGKGYKLE